MTSWVTQKAKGGPSLTQETKDQRTDEGDGWRLTSAHLAQNIYNIQSRSLKVSVTDMLSRSLPELNLFSLSKSRFSKKEQFNVFANPIMTYYSSIAKLSRLMKFFFYNSRSRPQKSLAPQNCAQPVRHFLYNKKHLL